MFVARYDTYAISVLADEALQWRRALTAGKREDKLFGTELTLDIGKKPQSMPMQITNDPSIVSKVNVVVFVVSSSAHGVDEYTEEVLVGLSDEFRELKKTIAANVQLDLKDGCTLYQWYMDVTPVKFRMNTCAACTGLMHPMRPDYTASCPTSSTGTLQRLSRLVSVSRRGLDGLRAGFVCADGTMTGSVDEVVCEGGNCTASALGQRMISTSRVS